MLLPELADDARGTGQVRPLRQRQRVGDLRVAGPVPTCRHGLRRHYTARKADVERVLPGLRVAVEDLMHQANLVG
jgi:hypothetical protein